jgi:hypothetical protein
VRIHGPKKWSLIAEHLPGRIGKQCRERCVGPRLQCFEFGRVWRPAAAAGVRRALSPRLHWRMHCTAHFCVSKLTAER